VPVYFVRPSCKSIHSVPIPELQVQSARSSQSCPLHIEGFRSKEATCILENSCVFSGKLGRIITFIKHIFALCDFPPSTQFFFAIMPSLDRLHSLPELDIFLYFPFLPRPRPVLLIHCVSKKLCKLIFSHNFVKFRPTVKIRGTKIAEKTSFSEVYSFSTSPNLCQRTTVLNPDVPNCYITQ